MGHSRYGNLQKHLNPNPLQRRLLRRFHRRIIRLVQSTGARHLLDAGCGEGFTMRALVEAGLQMEMVGVDFSREGLAWHQARQMAHSPLQVADVHRLPFRDGSFDLALCLEVLEHLPDSALGLRELLRISRDYVLVSVPHEPFFRGANFLRGKHLNALGNDPEHLHNYSGRAFRRLVSAQASLVWHGYSFPWQIALARKK
ncbi:MAG: methyltransferase domain-containing protein [Anaerolineae bacterium]